jgi:hypothetical protein
MPCFLMNEISFKLRRHPSCDEVAAAIHEASHVVVAMAREARVMHASIAQQPYGMHRWEGEMHWDGSIHDDEGRRILDEGLVTVAPRAAMSFMDGPIRAKEFDWHELSTGDLASMRKHHEKWMDPFPRYVDFEQRMAAAAEAILWQHRREFEQVAYALLRLGELDEDDLRRLSSDLPTRWEAHKPKPKPAPVRSTVKPLRLGGARPLETMARLDGAAQRGGSVDWPRLEYSAAVPISSRNLH